MLLVMTEISSETEREDPPARKWPELGTKKTKVLLSAALNPTGYEVLQD